jgi:hypothetical protein
MNWHAGKVFRELRKLTFLFTATGICIRRKQLEETGSSGDQRPGHVTVQPLGQVRSGPSHASDVLVQVERKPPSAEKFLTPLSHMHQTKTTYSLGAWLCTITSKYE